MERDVPTRRQGLHRRHKDPSRSWMDKYIHPDDQQRVKSVIQEAIRNKKIFQLEHRVLRADGSLGWAFSRAVPLLDESGAIVEWFGAVSDIASHKKMEQELLEAQSELECRVQQRTKELERAQTDLRPLRQAAAVAGQRASSHLARTA